MWPLEKAHYTREGFLHSLQIGNRALECRPTTPLARESLQGKAGDPQHEYSDNIY